MLLFRSQQKLCYLSAITGIYLQMQELDDNTLLREYVERDSQEAFATVVARHVNKVYSVALRHTRNPHQAEEITQAVFVILAQKANKLHQHAVLSGWLYQTARLTAVTFIRSEIRRARCEQEAFMQTLQNETESDLWPQIAPLLDSAMAGLNERDRHAIVLRFFDGKSMKEVGAVLGASEDATKMRVKRAVEKLRLFFGKRGIVAPAAALTAAISANSVQAAPVALAKAATTVSLTKGATASASTATLIKGALKVMAWSKAKAAIITAAIILAAGTTATLMNQSTSRTDLPGSAWTFAGYGSPVATIQTMAWAVKRNDSQTMFGCLTPDYQAEFRKATAQAKPGTSTEGFLLQTWKQQLEGRTGIRIVQSVQLTTNQTMLSMTLKGGPATDEHWIRFQKIGDEWKIDDLDPRGKNGRTGMITGPVAYGGIGIAMTFDTNSHAILITNVVANSAAWQAGLTPGLIVQKIDGVPTADKSLSECVFRVRGAVGTKVFLELVNPESRQTNVIELTRRALVLNPQTKK
jgi:RNA polymerase sigma factor (sigma-70 family)